MPDMRRMPNPLLALITSSKRVRLAQGRYIMPFRSQWLPSSDGFVVGNMKR